MILSIQENGTGTVKLVHSANYSSFLLYTGRVLVRFSKDLYFLDNVLSRHFFIVLDVSCCTSERTKIMEFIIPITGICHISAIKYGHNYCNAYYTHIYTRCTLISLVYMPMHSSSVVFSFILHFMHAQMQLLHISQVIM